MHRPSQCPGKNRPGCLLEFQPSAYRHWGDRPDVEGEDTLPLHPSQSPTLLASLQENLRIVLQKLTRSWFETPHAQRDWFIWADSKEAGYAGSTAPGYRSCLCLSFTWPTTAPKNRALGIASLEHSKLQVKCQCVLSGPWIITHHSRKKQFKAISPAYYAVNRTLPTAPPTKPLSRVDCECDSSRITKDENNICFRGLWDPLVSSLENSR